MARSKTTFTKETAPRTGKKKGSKRKTTILTQNAELLAAKDLMTPLEVLQGFACNQKTPDSLRVTAATAAARYVHQAQPLAINMSGELRLRRTFADAVMGTSNIKLPPQEDEEES